MVRDETYCAPWAQFNLTVWLDTSETFRRLGPDDRRLAATLFLWNSARGPIPDIPIALARAAWEDDTARVAEIRGKLPSFGFQLEDGKWSNPTAMKQWMKARGLSEKRAEAGAAGGNATAAARASVAAEGAAEVAAGGAVAIAGANAVATPSPSHSLSPSQSLLVDQVVRVDVNKDKSITYKWEAQADLFEPTKTPDRARGVTERYITARAMRKWGIAGKRAGILSAGAQEKIRARIERRLAEGFPWELIVCLPVALPDKSLFMLDDAETLLRDGSKPRTTREGFTAGATDHLAKLDSGLSEVVFDKNQRAILRNVGIYEYVKGRGAKASEGGWE